MNNEEKVKQVFQFKDRESWIQALQNEPNEGWVKERVLGGGKTSHYVPLPIQQALADKFFRECDVIEEKYQVIVNEILCTVKICILPDYPDSEHRYITGTAAKPIQQDQGSFASSFPNAKKPNALEYNAPASRSAAISNAFTTFGNIFGRNLSREIKTGFSFIRNKEENGTTNSNESKK